MFWWNASIAFITVCFCIVRLVEVPSVSPVLESPAMDFEFVVVSVVVESVIIGGFECERFSMVSWTSCLGTCCRARWREDEPILPLSLCVSLVTFCDANQRGNNNGRK